MNRRSSILALTLAATLAVPAASHAAGWGIFGTSSRPEGETLGLGELGNEEFPSFGNFTWKEGAVIKERRSAAFGMVYRTHRHILARRRAGHQRFSSWLSDALPLGKVQETEFLQGMMAQDNLTSPMFTAQAKSPDDAREYLLARLEGADRRELSFAISSPSRSRLRPIFVYRAVRQSGYWVCDFYDPQINAEKLGIKANEKRRFQLRVPVEGGTPEVSSQWVLQAGVRSKEWFVSDTEGDWAPLTWDQLFEADSRESQYAWFPDFLENIEEYQDEDEVAPRSFESLGTGGQLSRMTQEVGEVATRRMWDPRKKSLKYQALDSFGASNGTLD
jgi:hypothetical protein